MSNIIEITDFLDPALDVYARLTENQLVNREHPEDGLFIAESPKVIHRAPDAGCIPVSILMEKQQIEGEARDSLADSCISGCDYTVRIPMSHGWIPLNVAVASAVAFFQLGTRDGARFPFALHNRPHHTRTSVFARLVGPRYFPDFVRLILPRHFPRFLSPIVSPFVPINLQFIVCIFFSYDCTNSLTKFMSKF